MATMLPNDLLGVRRADMLAAAAEQMRYNVADPSGWQVDATSGHPATAIADLAAEQNAALIVMGLGKHDLIARMFGSETALAVIQRARVPVLAVPQNWIGIPRRVLVAVDFGQASLRAARTAMRIVASGGTVCFTHVAPELGVRGHNAQITAIHEGGVNAELDRFIAAVGVPAGVTVTRAPLYGETAPALLEHARAHASDMLVAGTHGLDALTRLLVGSVAAKLVRGAQCAVLIASAAANDVS
jgi:nucleotide-binding universal stress UspA family protein